MQKRVFAASVTLLFLATCSSSSRDHRKALLELGVIWNGEAFLEYAKEGDLAILELFLKGGMDVETRDRSGATALMHAASNGHVEATSLLIAEGAHVNVQDNLGRRALDYATVHPESGTFKVLASAGALYGMTLQ
ncbi:MAG: ankyrin repeat domain-containing protein [Acidobacteria bacterium]|nr:MAG: ankyrin repeat domain-containing protein [Acidobacteriota bacterium]